MINDSLTLYHATSEYALEQIRKDGFIGVTEEIMLSHIRDVFNRLNVPDCKRTKYYKKIIKDLEKYAPNGMVSFFPKKTNREMIGYCRMLGEKLGESFGNDIRRAVIYASRVTKTSFKENLTKIPIMMQKHIPIVLTVIIPSEMISNQEDIGSSFEHYTIGVVPVEFITNVKYI